MPKPSLRFLALLLPAAGLLATGCGGYTSTYVPPQDGRPRLIWADNSVLPVIANAVPGTCTEEVDALAGGDTSRPARVRASGGGTYYVPVHTVVVVDARGAGIVPIPHPIFVGGFSGGGGLKLGNVGSGSGDLGKAAIFVAVLAIAVLPFVALGLATGRPEPEAEVARAIDRVNAQTDLARSEGSPCDELVVAGQESPQ